MQREIALTPEELLFAALLRLAIRDARQGKDERLREEAAAAFLWTVAPSVADRAKVTPCIATDNA